MEFTVRSHFFFPHSLWRYPLGGEKSVPSQTLKTLQETQLHWEMIRGDSQKRRDPFPKHNTPPLFFPWKLLFRLIRSRSSKGKSSAVPASPQEINFIKSLRRGCFLPPSGQPLTPDFSLPHRPPRTPQTVGLTMMPGSGFQQSSCWLSSLQIYNPSKTRLHLKNEVFGSFKATGTLSRKGVG